MNETDQLSWQIAFFLVGSLLVIGVVISVIVWQIFATARAKMSVAREEAYQELAGRATASMEAVSAALERANAELADLRERAQETERILKEVG